MDLVEQEKIFPSAAATYCALILGFLFHGDFGDWDGCGADFALIQGLDVVRTFRYYGASTQASAEDLGRLLRRRARGLSVVGWDSTDARVLFVTRGGSGRKRVP
jgi:hypothetical protein